MDLNGTSAIVTGGASGLGDATCRLLAERGVHVVVADLQADKGEALAQELSGLFVQCDVTDTEQVIATVEAAIEMAPLGRSSTAPASAGPPGRSARTASTPRPTTSTLSPGDRDQPDRDVQLHPARRHRK